MDGIILTVILITAIGYLEYNRSTAMSKRTKKPKVKTMTTTKARHVLRVLVDNANDNSRYADDVRRVLGHKPHAEQMMDIMGYGTF